MWRLFNLLFGWDYIWWRNSADKGVARVFNEGSSRAVYWRYRLARVMDVIHDEKQVVWLTCKPSKYMTAAQAKGADHAKTR